MRLRNIAQILLLISCMLFLPCCNSRAKTSIQDPRQDAKFDDRVIEELDQFLSSSLETLDVPGICVGLWVEGVGSYERCVGVTKIATTDPISLDHHIRIGSITKTVTATILLRLVEEGLLSLDDPISKYFENSPKPEVTIFQLANMTSGLANYTFDPGFQEKLFSQADIKWDPRELIQIGFDNTVAGCPNSPSHCFNPGDRFAYSNTNYAILGMILEKVSQKTYSQLLREYIVSPLGLKHTFQPQDNLLPEPFAHGYTFQGSTEERREVTNSNVGWGFGTGDLVSTGRDLSIWAKALGTGSLLKPETRAILFTKSTAPPNKPDHYYAFGIGYQFGWWGHAGSLPGYNSEILYRPDAKATVVVTVNHDDVTLNGKQVSPAHYIIDKIIEIAAREAPLGDISEQSITEDPSLQGDLINQN